MMFGKYQIVAFKDGDVAPKSFSIHTSILYIIAVAIAVLLVGSIVLWGNFYKVLFLEKQLVQKETMLGKQEEAIVDLVNTVRTVQEDFVRLQQTNAQLRAMAGLKSDKTADAVGGVTESSLESQYLPLHRQDLLTRKIQAFLKQVEANITLEEVQQQELMHVFADQKDLEASTPIGWPVRLGRVSSSFGPRRSPFDGLSTDFHRGIDIAASLGTPIYAPAKGVVVFVGKQNGYGNVVFIKHRAGISTRYAHMQRYIVTKNQRVKRGDIIGYVGNTGRSTGPHLHYEVRLGGVSVNPMKYLTRR